MVYHLWHHQLLLKNYFQLEETQVTATDTDTDDQNKDDPEGVMETSRFAMNVCRHPQNLNKKQIEKYIPYRIMGGGGVGVGEERHIAL